MSSRILCRVCCILLTVMDKIRETKSFHHLQPIQFVLANRNGPAVAMRSDAAITELRGAMAESYNVSFPFELQLSGETIVSSRSLSNQSLDNISSIISIAKDLNEIYGPGFMIPLRLHRLLALDSDIGTYTSLSRMFGGPDSNIQDFEWYQFILKCVESRSCPIQDLSDRFEHHFNCENGKLTVINLRRQHIKGSLDLSSIPWTVRKIYLKGNALTKLNGLDQLAGKELRSLDIRANPLEIDLKFFDASLLGANHNPLKVLHVNMFQISWSLIRTETKQHREECLRFLNEVCKAAAIWIESTTLDLIVIGGRDRCRHRKVRKVSAQEVEAKCYRVADGLENLHFVGHLFYLDLFVYAYRSIRMSESHSLSGDKDEQGNDRRFISRNSKT